MLREAVGARWWRGRGEGTVVQRRAEIHGERHRLAQQCRVLQHRVEHHRRCDATKRANHVGVSRRGGAGLPAHGGGREGDGLIEGVWGSHGPKCADDPIVIPV